MCGHTDCRGLLAEHFETWQQSRGTACQELASIPNLETFHARIYARSLAGDANLSCKDADSGFAMHGIV